MRRNVLVVGAGPSGVQAAHQLVSRGLDVEMIDFGISTARDWEPMASGQAFLDVRTRAKEQSPLWWGDDYSDFPFEARKGGAGLTPPRTFTIEEVDEWTPVRTQGFAPVESLAKGGLGEAWGLGAFALAREELATMGLDVQGIQASYARVCARIGISGAEIAGSLPPLELDEAAERLWARYTEREAEFSRIGLCARRTPLALLSQPFNGREATPYSDMDFYLNPGRSAYRPGFDVDQLRQRAGFSYSGGWLAVTVREKSAGVEVEAISRTDRARRVFSGDAVVVCAGTLGTARLALRSRLVRWDGAATQRWLRLACSPYFQIVAVQPACVGRVLRDRRHSMGQIVVTLEDRGRPTWVPLASLLSYRSLLLTRLMREAPIPVRQARSIFQLLQSGLVVAGVFFPQRLEDATVRLRLEPDVQSPTGDRLVVEDTAEEGGDSAAQARALAKFRRGLRRMGALPLRTLRLSHGSSIHYGGTLPFGSKTDALTGRLLGSERVFVGDGSPFRMVPGKGITLTLMAYADWVADRVAERTVV